MSNVTKDECQLLQDTATQFSQLAMITDAKLIERYIKQASLQMDGTLDPIMAHFMSIQDMRKGQGNLKFVVGVLQCILKMQKLVEEQIKHEKGKAA